MSPSNIIIGGRYILNEQKGVWTCKAHSARRVAKTHTYHFWRRGVDLWEVTPEQVDRAAPPEELLEDLKEA